MSESDGTAVVRLRDRLKNKISRRKRSSLQSSATSGQHEDDDDTAVEMQRTTDEGDMPSSASATEPSSNLGVVEAKSPWEVALAALNPLQKTALSRYGFQNQDPSELFKTEIEHIRELRDRCDRGLVAGADSKTFSTRGRVHSILRIAEKYAIIGDIAIQHHSETVALVWAGVRMSLQVALNDLTTFDHLSSVLGDIATTMHACGIYANLYQSCMLPSARALMDGLSTVYSPCLKLIAETIIYSEEKTAKRISKGITNPFETRFQPLIQDINGERKKLETYAQAVLHESLTRFPKALGDGEREKVLEWVSTIRHGDYHEDVKRPRVSGAGEWLFQNSVFLSWLECESSSMLWLRGKVGCGKTVLSSTVIDTLTATYKSTPTIYFYCKFDEQPRKQAPTIIRSLLKQLSGASENLGVGVLGAFRGAKEKGYPTTSVSESDAKSLFTATMSQAGEAFIIIDAMDDCEEDERDILISFFLELLAVDNFQAKILLTTRPEDDIHQSFKGCGSKNIRTYNIEVGDTVQDIEPFVTQTVDKLVERNLLLSGGPITQEFRQHLITTLIEESGGMFLWARYQLKIIRKFGFKWNESQICAQLKQFPRGLEATYMRIWVRIQDFPDEISLQVYRTLMWLLGATRPLRRKEITMATAIKPLNTEFQENEQVSLEYLISACCNLVYLDEKEDVLRFVHSSAKEFLERQPELGDAEGFVADVCFTALGFPQRPTAIWNYAAHNWPRHARFWKEINHGREVLIERFLLSAPCLERWAIDSKQQVCPMEAEGALQPPTRYGAIGVCASLNVLTVLQYLVQRNIEHSAEDSSELISTALFLAALGGHVGVVASLLEAGANTLWQMRDYRVILRSDSQSGAALFKVDPNSAVAVSATALQVAAGGGNLKVVDLLIEAGADVNDSGRFYAPRVQGHHGSEIVCKTALQAACMKGSLAVVKRLVDAGADIDAMGWACGTPLQAAAVGGHEAVVAFLINAGANVNLKSPFCPHRERYEISRQTALDAALVNGFTAIAQRLRDAGASL